MSIEPESTEARLLKGSGKESAAMVRNGRCGDSDGWEWKRRQQRQILKEFDEIKSKPRAFYTYATQFSIPAVVFSLIGTVYALIDLLFFEMSSAQDPFYIVKEEIQDSIDKLLSNFHKWERIPADSQEQQKLTKELLVGCESIEWQQGNSYLQLLKTCFSDRKVDELDKAISVAARDPSWYGIDEAELDKRRRWTSTARTQVGNMKKKVVAGNELDDISTSNVNGMRRELMRMPNSHQTDRSNQYAAQDNDDFISSESDRQLLLIKQQDEELDELSASVERIGGVGLTIHEELLAQVGIVEAAILCKDEELDELSASVERIGGVGLTIHEELLAQEKIIDELGMDMESTTNRLDFVQKKVGMVMKKAGAKGQLMMILFLVVLFIVLFVLVFLT
ncbi:hypothetical protein TEA_008794 [Camellia sinensis var. sinensis]|uniref:t-SNARE coiled-coil homology domain-containing protein n=1 Tax=Camellia sinensis var. sinensis TaxID=542762 RepID=A0A4V3WRB9_CAMSN|nr:hypothetical protein TEA_008794 [Camellia sinensis var. sinensis]